MYLVDANVLIEAKNRYYAFDIAPGFWKWLDHAHANSLACSIDAVDWLLVAHARAHDHTLVTHERSQPNAKRRVLVPDACLAMGVEFADTFSMLRQTRARLELVTP
jgi:predicted nucleic acid-binding protein